MAEPLQIVYKDEDLYSIIRVDRNNNAFEYVRIKQREIVNRSYRYDPATATRPDKRLRDLLNTNKTEIAAERKKVIGHG